MTYYVSTGTLNHTHSSHFYGFVITTRKSGVVMHSCVYQCVCHSVCLSVRALSSQNHDLQTYSSTYLEYLGQAIDVV